MRSDGRDSGGNGSGAVYRIAFGRMNDEILSDSSECHDDTTG